MIREKVPPRPPTQMPIENPSCSMPATGAGRSDLRPDSGDVAKIHFWTRRLERDPEAKNYTDEALRPVDDYERQEMYQLTEAARQAGAKAKRIEEHKHARVHAAEPAVEVGKWGGLRYAASGQGATCARVLPA